MAGRGVQLIAILLTAVAVVPGGAHLFVLPNKIGLDSDAYFTVQAIYLGWWKFGLVLFGVLAVDAVLALGLRGVRPAFAFAIAALGLMALNLAIFFLWTFPANQATANWTMVPPNWEELRRAWEYSHAVNAFVSFASLICVTAASLTSRR